MAGNSSQMEIVRSIWSLSGNIFLGEGEMLLYKETCVPPMVLIVLKLCKDGIYARHGS